MSDEPIAEDDDETRVVRREDPDDATRLVVRSRPGDDDLDDATRLVVRDDDATRIVRRGADDRADDPDATRLIRHDESGPGAQRPRRSAPPTPFQPITPDRTLVPEGVSSAPSDVYRARSIEQEPVRRVDFTGEPSRRVVAGGHDQPQQARRGSRTVVLAVAIGAAVVLAGVVAAVAIVLLR